jgi:peptide/nickel transport system permease protein
VSAPPRRFPIPTRHYPRHRLPRRRPGLLALPLARAGLALLLIILVAVVVGPAFVPWSPGAVQVEVALQPPGPDHPLGTDMFGRDVLSRLLHGGRLSLGAGIAAVLAALLPGSLLGIAAGYRGGWLDEVVSAVVNVLLAFPGLLLALVLTWLLGRGIENAALGVAIAGVPIYVRLARSHVRQLRRSAYVRAAQAVGVPEGRILWRHILPNVVSPLLSVAVLDLGWAILNVSAISFLGVGARAPQPEWGLMLAESRSFLRQAPWLGLAPGSAIALTVLAANLLADAVQVRLDPAGPFHLRPARG